MGEVLRISDSPPSAVLYMASLVCFPSGHQALVTHRRVTRFELRSTGAYQVMPLVNLLLLLHHVVSVAGTQDLQQNRQSPAYRQRLLFAGILFSGGARPRGSRLSSLPVTQTACRRP